MSSGKAVFNPKDTIKEYKSFTTERTGTSFSEEEVAILLDILSIFDNRHDFKEGGRNKSLTIDEVLQLLQQKATYIQKFIEKKSLKNKTILLNFLEIHCKNIVAITKDACGTVINPDKEVEYYMFNKIFTEESIETKPRIIYNPGTFVNINGKVIHFKNMQAIASACGCIVDGPGEKGKVAVKPGQRNPFLDNLLTQLGNEMGVESNTIRFCIDVSSIGEWVFRHDGIPSQETHIKTIADDYDCFRSNPEGRRDLVSTPEEHIQLDTNHVILSTFNLYNDKITWASASSAKPEVTINLSGVQRAGVNIMAEAIRVVLDDRMSKKSKISKRSVGAVKLVNEIFNIPLDNPLIYGKHIMDFKRLMDTAKLTAAQFLSKSSGLNVILVTHDHMLYLIAKMLQCPVILTMKNFNHSREMYIDIPISKEKRDEILKARISEAAIFLKDPIILKPFILNNDILQIKSVSINKNSKDPTEFFYHGLTNLIQIFSNIHSRLTDTLTKINIDGIDKVYLVNDIKDYNSIVPYLNSITFEQNADIYSKINTIITKLKDAQDKEASKLTNNMNDILRNFINYFEGILTVPKYTTTGFGRVSKPTQLFNTEFLTTFNMFLKTQKQLQTGGGEEDIIYIGNCALELLYKFIDKNLIRYYSQPLHIQQQMMIEAYSELHPRSAINVHQLKIFETGIEALFEEYIKRDEIKVKRVRSPTASEQSAVKKVAPSAKQREEGNLQQRLLRTLYTIPDD